MAASTVPIFCDTPNLGLGRLTAANTTRDASTTTNIVTCFTSGADGSRVERINFTNAQASAAACTANVGRVWIHDGTNYRLIAEVAWAATTASATAVGQKSTISFPGGLIIPAGWTIRCAIHTYTGAQDQTDVSVEGADY